MTKQTYNFKNYRMYNHEEYLTVNTFIAILDDLIQCERNCAWVKAWQGFLVHLENHYEMNDAET